MDIYDAVLPTAASASLFRYAAAAEARWTCAEPGCGRSAATGDALHRTSPKGEQFAGKCTEHHASPDPVAVLIEDRNHEATS